MHFCLKKNTNQQHVICPNSSWKCQTVVLKITINLMWVIRVPAEGAFLLSSLVFLVFSFSPCLLVSSRYSLWAGQQHLSVSLPQLPVQLWREDERKHEWGSSREAAAGTLAQRDSPMLQSLAMPLSFSRLFLYPNDSRDANKRIRPNLLQLGRFNFTDCVRYIKSQD